MRFVLRSFAFIARRGILAIKLVPENFLPTCDLDGVYEQSFDMIEEPDKLESYIRGVSEPMVW